MTLSPKDTAGPRWATLDALLAAVRDCRACERYLPLGARPVLRAHESARILVVGQAPRSPAQAHARDDGRIVA